MANEETFHQLRLIRSRLEAIEHTQEVLVRVEAAAIWADIEAAFDKDALLADVYQLVDGRRTQQDIVAGLKDAGAPAASEATVSRALRRLREDLQLVRMLDSDGRGNVHAHVRLHRILGLDRRINAWRRKREKASAS